VGSISSESFAASKGILIPQMLFCLFNLCPSYLLGFGGRPIWKFVHLALFDLSAVTFFLFSPQEMDVDLDTSLEEPENEYEGNKDAARALLRVKQKLDGYEDGEMRSTHGQVVCPHILPN
jgi:hypothetical protein